MATDPPVVNPEPPVPETAHPPPYDPTVPIPEWAPANSTWQALIAQYRLWLAPDDGLLSDLECQQIMVMSVSFTDAIRRGWQAKIRWYADPNRIVRGQIGSESLQFPDPNDLINWAKGIIKEIEREMGYGGSRVAGYGSSMWFGARVWGVTDYELAPPPVNYYGVGRRPSPWDVTRFPPQHWIDRSPWPR